MRRLMLAVSILVLIASSDSGVSPARADFLLVGSFDGDSVLRYDASTGAFVDTFVPAGSGGLDGPYGLAIGPDSNLYVARSLSEKQVKVDKDLRRAAAGRFLVFRGIAHFVPGSEIHKSLA